MLLNRASSTRSGCCLFCAESRSWTGAELQNDSQGGIGRELKGELGGAEANAVAAQQAIADYQKALTLSRDDKFATRSHRWRHHSRPFRQPRRERRLHCCIKKRETVTRPSSWPSRLFPMHAGRGMLSIREGRATPRGCFNAPPTTGFSRLPIGRRARRCQTQPPPGGNDFETSPLLIPCVYSGQFDVERSQPKYYKVALQRGQTLRVVLRTRGAKAAATEIKLHRPDGGNLGGYTAYGESSVTTPLEYKAGELGSAYVSLSGGVRGSALEVSVRRTTTA